MTPRDLEEYLFSLFPAQDAESWDHVGISVGFPDSEITAIALSLDPDPSSILQAKAAGCNVLLTHHPVFICAPDQIVIDSDAGMASNSIATALSSGVTLIAMHTNLDRTLEARQGYIDMLGAEFKGDLAGDVSLANFGAIGTYGSKLALADVASRCKSAYGRVARVWGKADDEVESIAIVGGSASDLVSNIIDSKVDCAIVGEMSYHKVLDLMEAGIAVIELGHDVSELPILNVLRHALDKDSRFASMIVMLERELQWWQP